MSKFHGHKIIRCAVYTRKSTEEGLDQEFSSLDAQRESAQAYIKSQAHQGWIYSRDHYDDGGFTGGNMDRPALQRLLADIAAGQVQCVVVYKVDRLSRSLLDFARMMETFDKHGVSFVSVTQQFNTATSMGRLVLNVLLSFAQFERELISERTRDKIAAARRKGKWVGGHPLLGYDVDSRGFKLIVNEEEAARVRAIFSLYLEQTGLIQAVQELERREWKNKSWVTRKGHGLGGQSFTKVSLHHLLTNVVYVGKVRYKKEIHEGEHAAIVPEALWQAVQDRLHRHGRTPGSRHPVHAPLGGLLRCRTCDCAMTPTFACNKGGRRYRYYVCLNTTRRGRGVCVSKGLSAPVIEDLIAQEIRKLGTHSPAWTPIEPALEWEALSSAEKAERFRRLIERVDYDGRDGKVFIRFKSSTSDSAQSKRLGSYASPVVAECVLKQKDRRSRSRLCTSIAADGRLPRITRLMALALRFDTLTRQGQVSDYSALARLGHVSRARITQIMNLLLLAPDIQEEILFLPCIDQGRPIHMAQLQPIARQWKWADQRRRWAVLRQSLKNPDNCLEVSDPSR